MKLNNTVRNSQAGFSLIELMVVVAIIGILAAVGIPQFAKFQSKARQSEAKASLSGLYSAEQSYLGDNSTYSSNLLTIGFAVSGSNLRYSTGFAGGTNYQSQITAANTANATFLAATGLNTGAAATYNYTGATGVAAGTNVAGASTFIAAAVGDPRNSAVAVSNSAVVDMWIIDQNKALSNARIGL